CFELRFPYALPGYFNFFKVGRNSKVSIHFCPRTPSDAKDLQQHEHEGYLREEALAELFSPIVEQVSLPEGITDWLRQGLKERIGKASNLNKLKHDNLQKEYDKTFARLNRLYDLRLDSNINDDIFKTKESELTSALACAKVQLEACKLNPASTMAEAESSLLLITQLQTLYKKANCSEKAQILKLIGKSYTLTGKAIVPEYRVPFNILAAHKSKRPELMSVSTESSRRLVWGG
ncbi:MAG: hypothetical protein WCS77_10930, partial [Elusimicrobiaceae bacterium]